MRKKIGAAFAIVFALIVGWGPTCEQAYAGIEWTVSKQLNLDVTPLDIAASTDGQWLYILAPNEILIYSLTDDKVIIRIALENGFDRVTYSPKENILILTNSTKKELKIIQLEIVHEFSTFGLPFRGPENAPVVITVFSDYQ